jgi:Polyketide cyclase / dehydrase and lipid transport
MSEVHVQAHLDAPVASVWDLIADPRRYRDWFPRTLEVRGERFSEGVEFVQVFQQPLVGRTEANFLIDRMNELQDLRMHCTISGLFIHWQLTGAQGGTFLDASFGMDPVRRLDRLTDPIFGRRFFERWLAEAVDRLKQAATEG